MGGNSSKPSSKLPSSTIPSENAKYPDNIVISKELYEKVMSIKDIVDAQKGNNLNKVVGNIDDLKKFADLMGVEGKTFERIKAHIDKYRSIITTKNQSGQDIGTDKVIQYLKVFQPSDADIVKNSLLTAAKKAKIDDKSSAQLTDFVDSVVNLSTSSRFFEYKYIQLNIVTFRIIKTLFESLVQFIEDVRNFNSLRTASQSAAVNDLVRILLEIVDKSKADDIDPALYDSLNGSMDKLLGDVSKWQEMLDKKTTEMNGDLINILNNITSLDESMLIDAEDSIKRSTLSPPGTGTGMGVAYAPMSTSASAPSSAYTAASAITQPVSSYGTASSSVQGQPMNGGFIRSGTSTGKQKGGFVRSGTGDQLVNSE